MHSQEPPRIESINQFIYFSPMTNYMYTATSTGRLKYLKTQPEQSKLSAISKTSITIPGGQKLTAARHCKHIFASEFFKMKAWDLT
jgi:hypothetical protein